MNKIINSTNRVLLEMDDCYWKNVAFFIGSLSEESEKYPDVSDAFCQLIIANIEVQELRHRGYQSIMENKDSQENVNEIIGQSKLLLSISEGEVKSLEMTFYEKLKTFNSDQREEVINLYNVLLKILNPKTQKETCEKIFAPREKCVS